jgi:hypothetical protein
MQDIIRFIGSASSMTLLRPERSSAKYSNLRYWPKGSQLSQLHRTNLWGGQLDDEVEVEILQQEHQLASWTVILASGGVHMLD